MFSTLERAQVFVISFISVYNCDLQCLDHMSNKMRSDHFIPKKL